MGKKNKKRTREEKSALSENFRQRADSAPPVSKYARKQARLRVEAAAEAKNPTPAEPPVAVPQKLPEVSARPSHFGPTAKAFGDAGRTGAYHTRREPSDASYKNRSDFAGAPPELAAFVTPAYRGAGTFKIQLFNEVFPAVHQPDKPCWFHAERVKSVWKITRFIGVLDGQNNFQGERDERELVTADRVSKGDMIRELAVWVLMQRTALPGLSERLFPEARSITSRRQHPNAAPPEQDYKG